MFILYTDADNELKHNHEGDIYGNAWYYSDRIVGYVQHRGGFHSATKRALAAFREHSPRDAQGLTIKHYIPYSRIYKQILSNMINHDGANRTKGMTREQAAKYLDHPLNQLGVNRREFGEPVEDAWESRVRFDAWVSWALHTICGYPDNLFQGDSSGDGRGAFVDDPSRDDIMNRVERGARVLKHIIVGLNVEPRVTDPQKPGYSEYIPDEDDWFLPYFANH